MKFSVPCTLAITDYTVLELLCYWLQLVAILQLRIIPGSSLSDDSLHDGDREYTGLEFAPRPPWYTTAVRAAYRLIVIVVVVN